MFLNKKLDKLIMRKYKIALLLPSILILFLSSRATGRTSANVHQKKTYLEQWINIEHISLEQGLFQISVSCIAQDSKGFIWFGTQGGLNRYDGYHFKAFKHHLDKSTTLNTNWVPDLYTDQKGTLWIVTTDGMLHKYNVENENFKRLLINTSYKNQRVFVNTIFMDLNGLMWVSIAGQGLLAFNPLNNENSSLNFTLIKHDTTDPNARVIILSLQFIKTVQEAYGLAPKKVV